jgi:Ca2+-binding RTX toxin-like protein
MRPSGGNARGPYSLEEGDGRMIGQVRSVRTGPTTALVIAWVVVVGFLAGIHTASAATMTSTTVTAATCPGFTGDTRNQVIGTAGDDVLVGTSGDDVICGLGGNDTLRGSTGNDVIKGGSGDDDMHGGAGDDILRGGTGPDTALGNRGIDTCRSAVAMRGCEN